MIMHRVSTHIDMRKLDCCLCTHVIMRSLSTRVAACKSGTCVELRRPGTIVFQYQEVVASYGNHVPCRRVKYRSEWAQEKVFLSDQIHIGSYPVSELESYWIASQSRVHK